MSEIEIPRKNRKNSANTEKEINQDVVQEPGEEMAQELALESEAVLTESSIFLNEADLGEGFLPEVDSDEEGSLEDELLQSADKADIESSELAGFESVDISDVEFIEDERLESILESILFASDRPVSLASIKEIFKGTNVRKDKIRRVLDQLSVTFASGNRGVQLVEVLGGYQLRTKLDNLEFIKKSVKNRPFRLSGPALEVLSIVAYKQPVVKNEVDQIRGVESGHLLRALMEKGLCVFEGKAEEMPGKPMQYGTTRRFLEIFGLRNLKELPTLSQIDELLPEGIGNDEEQKPTLAMVTDSLSENVRDVSYSGGEEELGKIESELSDISTSSEFFEQEKIRQKNLKEAERAQDIREALLVGESVSNRDKNWLTKHDESLLPRTLSVDVSAEVRETATPEGEIETDFDKSSVEEEVDDLEFRDEADEGATH